MDSKNWKMAACFNGKITFLTFVCHLAVQALCICFIIILPILLQKLELWVPGPSNNKDRCFQNLDAGRASSNYAPNRLFIYGGLSFLNLMVSRLLRIIIELCSKQTFCLWGLVFS